MSRSSFYYEPQVSVLKPEQQELLNLVDETYTSHPFFGTR